MCNISAEKPASAQLCVILSIPLVQTRGQAFVAGGSKFVGKRQFCMGLAG